MTKVEFFKKIYSKEYLVLIGIGFLPLLWKILEISFLASFENALKILGQITLIGIIFKIFEESILNPLYKILSKNNIDNDGKKNNIIAKFLIVYSVATVMFTSLLLVLNGSILTVSKVPDYIFNETMNFFKIYIIACGFNAISKYLYTCSVISKETKKLAIYLAIKSVATTLLFIILVPKFAVGLGVNGIAITEAIINFITIVYLLIPLLKSKKESANLNLKEYFKLFGFSLMETLIRNAVYYFVILVFLNILDNQDLYFVANDYIWSVMLIPVIAQSGIIKQEVSNGNSNIKPYFINSVILMAFMMVVLPVSLLVFKYIYNLPNTMEYFMVLLKLFPCYLIFVIDSCIEPYFISTGKLHHILIQSIITNILVYCTALILYLFGVWTITIDAIILLFNLGVIVSSIYTISIYFYEKRKEKNKPIDNATM